jgi:F5/8 type C domain
MASRAALFVQRFWFAVLFTLSVAGAALPAFSQSVLTRDYDAQRTNANLSETVLNQSNVNANQFGKLFQVQVDDQVFAQVLYMPGLSISGGTHNVIFVATASNTIYAFDADTAGAALWQRNFNNGGRPTVNSEVGQNCNPYLDFSGNIGIVGTPVIDASTNTMYFVARTVENGSTVQRLRAIDVTTGADRASNPQVTISASGFDPTIQNQRPSLALSGGVVYIGWASFCDTGSYHGFLMAYDASAFSQLGVFNTTSSGSQGGIWMSGIAPAFDSSGNVYFSTGNGSFDGSSNFGESLLKLAPRTLARLDSFTPSNWNTLNSGDTDFGSGGPLFIPGTSVIATGGKEGKIFVISSANLGGVVSGDTQILQSFQAVDPTVVPNATYHIHNGSAIWNGPQGVNLYISGENDHVRAYRFNSSTQTFNVPAFAVGSFLPPRGMPGSMLTISANGSQSGTGVLWSYTPRLGDANQKVVPGVLTAYNAETLAQIWMSGTNPEDDTFNYTKGAPPTIANGKVYLASFSNTITVYGLRTSSSSQNLALNKPATGSTSCNSNETPDKAVNGSYSGGNSDKWCSLTSPSFLQVDLGSSVTIGQIIVEHAGAGFEGGSLDSSGRPNFDINTSAYNLQVSTDGTNFTTVINVSGNIQSITTHNIAPVTARFVKLNITTPTRTSDTASRIYELKVYPPIGNPGGTIVNLSSAFNLSSGIVNDGTTFSGGGLDGGGRSYSANLLGSSRTFGGTTFSLGPANAADVVTSGANVSLPSGQFSGLKMLAAGVNGNQASQTFTVTYTDNTTQTFTQSLSDWAHPQNFAGESTAVNMAYRDISNGTTDNHTTFNVYAYSFALNTAKTVKSVTLPNNRNVVVLALTLR